MFKFTSSSYFKSLIAALVVCTFGFISVLAVMDPECTHCTLSIANKAMLGAKILGSGWLVAGTMISWDFRQTISKKVVVGLQSVRLNFSTTKDIKA